VQSAWMRILIPIVLTTSLATSAHAEFKFLETDDLELVYFDPSHTFLTPWVGRCLENSLDSQRARFGYSPDGRVTVVLMDRSDFGNAFASTVPENRLFLEVSPMNLTFETFSSGERMRTLANHELVHIVTMDQSAAVDRRFRRLFAGKVVAEASHPETILYSYLTNPRFTAPYWYHEGIAVFMETWMAGGLGRAQGAYDEMVFRAMVRDGARFYDPLDLESVGNDVDFQTKTNSYLYGTRFVSYLAYRYSPEQVIAWARRDDGSAGYYSYEFPRVFGVPMEEAWQDWIRWEHEFQTANLRSVREHPTTPVTDVTSRALGSVSRAFVDREAREIYVAVRYPGAVGHLAAIALDDGSLRPLQEVSLPMKFKVTSLAYDAGTKTLFYTDDNERYRDLKAYDVATGKARTLLADARIGDLAFDPVDRSLWGVRHLNGLATLVRVPFPYDKWYQMHTFAYGEILYDLDVSRDGTLIATSFGDVTGKQSLRVYSMASIEAGDPAPVATFDFGDAVPESFVFSGDGRYLYGSSYYTGVSNIFRYELATGDIVALSNAETGFFRPVPLDDGRLLVFRYTGQGFVAATIQPEPLEDLSAITFLGAEIVKRHPVVKDWSIGSPAKVDLDARVTRSGTYHAFRSIALESVYPVIEGYKDSVGAGLHARFSDPVGLDSASVTASFSPGHDLESSERLHAEAEYRHGFWTGRAAYNDADFYDLFGPTKRSRRGYSASLAYDRPLLFEEPRLLDLSAELAFYGDLETLPDFQNVAAAFDKLATAEVALEYRHLRSSLGSVDDEKGHSWKILARANEADGEFIPGLIGRYDVGFALPLAHSSIWLRSSAGLMSGDRENPLANIYFGGFGNNWVDDGDSKRYRDVLALPGFEINEIGGRGFAKTMLEWNLPPVRFSRVGTPGFFLTWARPALFCALLVTDPHDSDARRTVYDAGVQVDFRMEVLHRWPMTLSVGYAAGFESGSVQDHEFMLSLKVL
jgi:hypothetical protein